MEEKKADFGVKEVAQNSLREIRKLPNLDLLIKKKTPCYVWGISSYMQLLLATTPLGECNIVSFLDKSRFKQSKTIHGIPIEPPELLDTIREEKDVAVIYAADFI